MLLVYVILFSLFLSTIATKGWINGTAKSRVSWPSANGYYGELLTNISQKHQLPTTICIQVPSLSLVLWWELAIFPSAHTCYSKPAVAYRMSPKIVLCFFVLPCTCRLRLWRWPDSGLLCCIISCSLEGEGILLHQLHCGLLWQPEDINNMSRRDCGGAGRPDVSRPRSLWIWYWAEQQRIWEDHLQLAWYSYFGCLPKTPRFVVKIMATSIKLPYHDPNIQLPVQNANSRGWIWICFAEDVWSSWCKCYFRTMCCGLPSLECISRGLFV